MQGSFARVLNISGFDPSAGAGILAEIKTLQTLGVYGFGVCSALTFQNDSDFENVQWVSTGDIIKQIDVLLKRFDFPVVKIGLIENFDALNNILLYLKKEILGVKIIWDPIFNASAGFVFHDAITHADMEKLCKKIYLLTPNKIEVRKFTKDSFDKEEVIAKRLSSYCNVLLKDGHGNGRMVKDILFTPNAEFEFHHERLEGVKKHGSGCVFTSAISGFLAQGFTLEQSCEKAKDYIQSYLQTGEGQLGFHFQMANQLVS
jgi:hydroxymethylpyrimidine/phosphomethylpyrimidine kinase